MDVEWIRRVCIGLPHATEQVLWGADLVFKIGGKMFADALPRAEIRELLRESYGLVLARLPKKRQAKLQAGRKRKKGQAE